MVRVDCVNFPILNKMIAGKKREIEPNGEREKKRVKVDEASIRVPKPKKVKVTSMYVSVGHSFLTS